MAARPSPPPLATGNTGRRRGRVGPALATRAALAAVAVVVVLAAGCGDSGDNGSPAAAAPAGSEVATDLDAGVGDDTSAAEGPVDRVVLTRFEGGEATLADYRGRPLVVNFFASWCAPCVKEMPEFERVHQELGDNVAFLGVNVRDRAADGLRLAEQTGVTFDLLRDPRGELLAAVEGKAMPTTAFVTADGRLSLVENRTYRADTLRATIDEELLAPTAAVPDAEAGAGADEADAQPPTSR